MIKQIQLRGISRTPSDRMSEDGGLSESLNMYLDTAEQAPAFVPDDVTEELGLPADLEAERIFIHKTANYENYIVVQEGKIVAYTPGIEDEEPLLVMELAEGERVNDITSVGNTIILSSTKNIYYILYKDRNYSILGNKLPFPYIRFDAHKVERDANLYNGAIASGDVLWDGGIPSKESWNESGGSQTALNHLRRILEANIASNFKKGVLSAPIFVRYSIDILGDTSLSSMPLLVGAGQSNTFGKAEYYQVESYTSDDYEGTSSERKYSRIETDLPLFQIEANLEEANNLLDWSDVVKSIKIYISKGIVNNIDYTKSTMLDRESTTEQESTGPYSQTISYITEATIELLNSEALLLDSADTFLVKEIEIFEGEGNDYSKEFKELMSGKIIDIQKYFDTTSPDYIQLETQEHLDKDDMKHYDLISQKFETFNNRLMLIQNAQIIAYDYNRLNSYEQEDDLNINKAVYDVTYVLRGVKEDKVIVKRFETTQSEEIYAFQVFPDNRAYKMIVKVTSGGQTKYGVFNMYAHPYLDCAYYYGGINNKLNELCTEDRTQELEVNLIDDTENKLLVSEINKPFLFPIEGRYTFQSKVLGVAVATTALSQGQFGQFPLYVFTEDGIWAMETAADGSFISQKPLSREVCTNPDSITSIDNAVVFVTDKGVMMIQGSQVMNISPYMNGRHYIPNDSATNIIASQEGFSEFENVIKDETPFVAFMKKAKIAYDYAGQRLICIADDETFQYIYKLDTQTWHKVAFNGFDLIAPLNSYPDCLVQGEAQALLKKCIVDINSSEEGREYLIDRVKEYFPSLSESSIDSFLYGQEEIDVTSLNEDTLQDFQIEMSELAISTIVQEKETNVTKIYSLGTILDVDPKAEDAPKVSKGILITRPFDLGEPDVYKTIKAIKIRGDYDKGNVKYLLQGSDDGKIFYTLSSMRGKSWKMFRLFILADLEPTERISWVDIEYETRFKNRLR